MNTERPLANQLFLKALELPEGERRHYLDQACSGDDRLRAQIDSLLDASDQAGSFLNAPVPLVGVAATCEPPLERAGTQIGPYKLLQQIGEGGMGVVYMAEQHEPVKRRVALKIIKPGMDTRQVIARFEAERQALSLMDHPNIAKVLDAGTTESGRPYFVMELVKGQPITQYCDEHHLTPRQRLELLLPVCQAIQHAHQKGIIHRDIKPTNILVAEYDQKAVPKVIDFGVAKATGQALTEKTLDTAIGSIVGTLEYMSPEQAGINQLDIDTRSDIYSLGVILYELLAGSPPFTCKELHQAGMLEMLRVIREQEPSKPSTRLSTADGLPTLAANRGTDPAKLTKLLRGELDWIALKALEKDRSRRYETANGLAMDVQRFLADEPVLAHPPSAGYRLRKFLWRNKGFVIAISVILSCLIAGIIGTSASLIWALHEREVKAEALVAETKAREAEKRARERAMDALRSLTDEFVQNQMARGTTLTEENKVFLRKVISHFESFAAITADDQESRDIREEGYFRVGLMRYHLGETKEAEAAYNQALAILKPLTEDFPTVPVYRQRLGVLHNQLGNLFGDTGRLKEAEAAYLDSVAVLKPLETGAATTPDARQDLAGSYRNLANLYRTTGRLRQAEATYKEALNLHVRLITDNPSQPEFRSDLASSYNSFGNLLSFTGRLKEAEKAFRDALTIQRKLVAEFPADASYQMNLAASLNSLGVMLHGWGRNKDAEVVYAEAIAIQKQQAAAFPTLPGYRHSLALALSNLGIVYSETNRFAETESVYAEALTLRKRLAEDFPNQPDFRGELVASYVNLGSLFSNTKRPEKAEEFFLTALAIQQKLADEFPTRPDFQQALAAIHFNLGAIYRDAKKLPKALQALRDAASVHQKLADNFATRPEYRDLLAGTHNNLGLLLMTMGNRTEAEASYRQALKIKEKLVVDFPAMPSYAVYLGGGYCNFGNMLNEKNEPAAALEWFQKAIATLEPLAANEPRPINAREFLRNSHFARAVSLNALDRHSEATRDWKRAIELTDKPDKYLLSKYAESKLRQSHKAKDAAGCLAATAEYEDLIPTEVVGYYGSGCSRALCAATIAQDPNVPAADVARLVKEQEDMSLAWLRKALDAGFSSAEQLRTEKDLAAVRKREDFQALVTELQNKMK